jgi:hypothetical protein
VPDDAPRSWTPRFKAPRGPCGAREEHLAPLVWWHSPRLPSARRPSPRRRAASTPIRIIGEGRDASATIDSALVGTVGYQNERDNELTGCHVSDGDPSVRGPIGTEPPEFFDHGRDGHGSWRVFFTQQHGDNVIYEITARRWHQRQETRRSSSWRGPGCAGPGPAMSGVMPRTDARPVEAARLPLGLWVAATGHRRP